MTTTFTQGHAVLIGVGDDLPNTVDDATGLADILKDSGRCAYPADQVQILSDKGATRSHILDALEKLAATATPESTAIVYFSGHGYWARTPIGTGYYLMPFGYDVNRLYETAVSGDELAARLRAVPARRLLLLLDCCHAGGLDGSKAPGLNLSKAPLPPQAEALFTQGSGRVVIASSRADELSFAGKPYSAFTLALIESLAGAGVSKKDGYVRVADLALHTRQTVPQRTKDRQHPILHFEQADNFVLAYYAGGDTEPKELPFVEEPVIEAEPGILRAYQAQLSGSGAIAQGQGTAVGERGVYVSGNVGGSINTGDHKVQGDWVGGDKITVGNITGKGVAIGRGAQSIVTSYQLGGNIKWQPIPFRLDTALPNRVQQGHSFELAVAIRQSNSPTLEEPDLDKTKSGDLQVIWPEGAESVALRVHVSSPECIIHNGDSRSFRLYNGLDSPIFYFQLTPKQVGRLGIIVTVYQEQEWLGGVRLHTITQEQIAGKVEMKVDSQRLGTMYEGQVAVARNIEQYFNAAELYTLCYDLRVQHDDLRGETHAEKVRELVDYMKRRGRFADLVQICQEQRPHLDWERLANIIPTG